MKTPRPKICSQAHLNRTNSVARIDRYYEKAQEQNNTNKKNPNSKQRTNPYAH